MDVLGIRFDVADPRIAQLSRVQKDGLSLLRRCIKVAACTMADRKRLIRTLVIPKVTWAAGVAAMPLDFLTWLRREVLRTYGGKVSCRTLLLVLLWSCCRGMLILSSHHALLLSRRPVGSVFAHLLGWSLCQLRSARRPGLSGLLAPFKSCIAWGGLLRLMAALSIGPTTVASVGFFSSKLTVL